MSDSFLSQEEVDALLEGVTGESQKSVEEVARLALFEITTFPVKNVSFVGACHDGNRTNALRNFASGFSTSSAEALKFPSERWQCSVTARSCGLAVPHKLLVFIRYRRGSGLIVCEPSLVLGSLTRCTVEWVSFKLA